METEENKYYIPEIEEFHVGFECEFYNSKDKHFYFEAPDGWIKTMIGENLYLREFTNQYQLLKENLFRVKYLDQEDIESLGWKFIKHHPGTTQLDFKKGIYYLDFDSNFRGKSWLRIYEGDTQSEEFNFFTGFIKNKSELKILMKQLGI